MIGGRDVVINIATNAATRQWLDYRVRLYWRECVIEVESDLERFYYCDAAAKAAWNRDGGTDENLDTMIYAIFDPDALTLVVSAEERSNTATFAEALKEVLEEEKEEATKAQLRAERQALLSPGCCETMRRTKAIYAGGDCDLGKPAKWQLRLADSSSKVDESLFIAERQWFDDQYQKQKENPVEDAEFVGFVPPPTHCPFCGARLGELVKKTDPPAPLHHTTDENYCDTCGERNMNCTCWPPWAAWEERR